MMNKYYDKKRLSFEPFDVQNFDNAEQKKHPIEVQLLETR